MTRDFPRISGLFSKVCFKHREGSVTLHPVVNKHREAPKVFLEYPRETFGFPNLFLQKKVLSRRRHSSERVRRNDARFS